MAQTISTTFTSTRAVLLSIQIKSLLRRLTDMDDICIEKVMYGIEKQWFADIKIFAMDKGDKCHGQLIIEIDWDEHNRLKAIHNTVSVGDEYKDSIAPEVHEVSQGFLQFVNQYGFRTTWMLGHTDELGRNDNLLHEVRSTLGFSKADPIKWAGETHGEYLRVWELPELKLGLFLTKQENKHKKPTKI